MVAATREVATDVVSRRGASTWKLREELIAKGMQAAPESRPSQGEMVTESPNSTTSNNGLAMATTAPVAVPVAVLINKAVRIRERRALPELGSVTHPWRAVVL